LNVHLLEVLVDLRQAAVNQGLEYALIKQGAVHGWAVIAWQEANAKDLEQPERLLFRHIAG